MIRYLSRIFLIVCALSPLVAGFAAASDPEVA